MSEDEQAGGNKKVSAEVRIAEDNRSVAFVVISGFGKEIPGKRLAGILREAADEVEGVEMAVIA